MAASAVPCRAEAAVGHAVVGLEPVESSADVVVEIGDRRRFRVRLPAAFALVVKLEHGASGLYAVIDLRCGDDEAIAGQSHTPSQRRVGELEDVRVEDNARVSPGRLRAGHERAHCSILDRDFGVLLRDHHQVSR